MMCTKWLSFEKKRQEISTKLNVLRMRLKFRRMMKLRTDEENTSTSCSMKKVKK
jgi:hypothetical protein